MKKNEEYIVHCIDDTDQAFGVAKVDEQVVFIPDFLIGEKARIRIVKVCKTYAFGKVMELLESSKDRTEPLCKVNRLCGGCQLQYMSYEAELSLKHRQLKKLANRTLKREVEVRPVKGMEEPLYYRNKAQFPVQIIDGEVQIGFYRLHSHDIVECEACLIQNPVIQELYRCIKENITVSQAKGLRHIMIRYAQSTHQIQLVWIGSTCNDWCSIHAILNQKFGPLASIVFNKNTRKDNVILGNEYQVLQGSDSIIETCMGNKVQLHFKSFFQVNPTMMEVLYQSAIDAANLKKHMTCIDMYSGTGTIGMAISKYVDQVIGVEIVKEAVDNAKINAKMNGISNCEFECQDASEFVKEYKEAQKKADVVMIDPPRKGMSSQGILDVSALNPEKIVYVSCNPHTLVRDLVLFEDKGYTCLYIQPVDMFSQTMNLESVALLIKKQRLD